MGDEGDERLYWELTSRVNIGFTTTVALISGKCCSVKCDVQAWHPYWLRRRVVHCEVKSGVLQNRRAWRKRLTKSEQGIP